MGQYEFHLENSNGLLPKFCQLTWKNMMFRYFGFHYVTCSQPLDVPCACVKYRVGRISCLPNTDLSHFSNYAVTDYGIRRDFILAFCAKFERHTLQRRLSRNIGHGSCKICSVQVHLCPKSLPPLSKKWAKRWLFTSAVQDTNVIVGLKLLTTGTNVTTVLCSQGKK